MGFIIARRNGIVKGENRKIVGKQKLARGTNGDVLFRCPKENQKGLRLECLSVCSVLVKRLRLRRLSCARSRAYRPMCAARTHTTVCRERLGSPDFRSGPHASRSGCGADNPTIAISATSRAQGVRVRSARKMILWTIFSESGPEGPGCDAHRLLADARSARCVASL